MNFAIRDPINDLLDRNRLSAAARAGEILRVEIGKARVMALPGWYRTNIATLNIWRDEDWKYLFVCDNRIRSLLAEHVLEHIAPKLLSQGLANCYRFLEPSGRLRISVPDGYNPDPDYIAGVEPGGNGPAADDHRVLFNIDSLSIELRHAGFAVEPIEYYDENGVFHSVPYDTAEGWISRAGKPPPQRSLNVDGIKPG